MAARLRATEAANEISGSEPLPLREVFEACRNGDLARVKNLVIASNVNTRATKNTDDVKNVELAWMTHPDGLGL